MTVVTVLREDESSKTIEEILGSHDKDAIVKVVYPDDEAIYGLIHTGTDDQRYTRQERWRFTHPNLGDKLAWFEAFFPSYLAENGIDEEVAAHAGIIAAERLRNAYEHGVYFEPDGVIRVTAWIYPDGVNVGIADNGPGFDIEENLRPLEPGELRKRHHGLNIVRGLADGAYALHRGRDLFYRVRTSQLRSSPDA